MLTKDFRWVLLCGAVLAGTVLLTYSHVFTTDPYELSGRPDICRFFGPLALFMDYALHHGEVPLWNPLSFCGTPFAANPQAALFYPPNFIRALFNPNPTPMTTQATLVMMMGLHLMVMSAGVYLLARAHGLGRGASFAAAFAFMFSATMMRRVCAFHYITAKTWLPFLLLFYKRALDAPAMAAKLRNAIGAGLLLGMSILAGSIQILNFMLLTVGAYALLYRLLDPGDEDKPTARTRLRLWRNDAAVLAVILVLGALVACAMLLPARELASLSTRDKGAGMRLDVHSALRKLPMLYKNVVVYPGLRYSGETMRGSGVAALLLALASLTHPRRRKIALFAGLFLVLLDCTIGPPMPIATVVRWLTPFRIGFYTVAYDFALLPLCLLVGFGVEAITMPLKPRVWNIARTLLFGWLGFDMLTSLTVWMNTNPHDYLPYHPLVTVLPAIAVAFMLVAGWGHSPKTVRLLLPALIFAETLAWNMEYVPYLTDRRFTEMPGTFEYAPSFPQHNSRDADPMPNRFLYYLRPAINGFDSLQIGRVRDVIDAGGPEAIHQARVITDEDAVADNQRGNLFLKRSFWLARQWVKGPLPGKDELFPAATTVFLEDAEGLPVREVLRKDLPPSGVSDGSRKIRVRMDDGAKWPAQWYEEIHYVGVGVRLPTKLVVGRDRGTAGAIHSCLRLHYDGSLEAAIHTEMYDVALEDRAFRDSLVARSTWGKRIRLNDAKSEDDPIEMPAPRAAAARGSVHIHPSVRSVGRPRNMIEIPLPDYARSEVVVCITPQGRGRGSLRFTKAYVLCDQNDEDGLIRILARRANSVDLEVGELRGHRILTYLDAHYAGWKAYVDSMPVPIYLANDAFKAIVVPPGTHRVRFEFRPWRVYVGGAVSVAAVLAALAALVLMRPREAR